MEKIRIALADDHTVVRKSIAAMLQAEDDFQVVADAGNGRELISIVETLKLPPDVTVLDVNMPKMNGYETLVALKEAYPHMRFLILTQLEHEKIIVRMLKAGASGYVLKTSDTSELKRSIRDVMQHSYHLNDVVQGRLIGLVQKGEEYKKYAMTEKEEEFLKHCCSDLTYKEIAAKMGVPERTAAFYRDSLFDKLYVKSRTGLALIALRLGLVSIEEIK